MTRAHYTEHRPLVYISVQVRLYVYVFVCIVARAPDLLKLSVGRRLSLAGLAKVCTFAH